MKRDRKNALSGTKPLHRGKTLISTKKDRRADRSKGTTADCKQVEEALQWSEDALRAVTNTVQDAIIIIDDTGKISFWNPAAEKMFGYASHEAIGYKLHMLIAPRRYREGYRRGLEVFRTEGKGPLIGRAFRTEAQKKGGLEFPVEISFTSTRIKGKWYATGVIRDLTAHKRAEEEAKADEKRLRSLVKISQSKTATLQGLLNIALNEVVALSNSVFGYIYYYSEEKKEFMLHAWSKAVMKACTIPNPPTVYQLEKTGIWGEPVRQRRPLIVNDFTAHNPLKKGYPKGHAPLFRFMTIPVIHYERIVAVVGVANKATDYTDADLRELTQMMDAVWNIAERKRVEEALRVSEARFRTLFDTAMDGFILLDPLQRQTPVIVDVNQAACAMNEYSREELIGKPVTFLDEPQSAQKMTATIRKIMEGDTVVFEIDHIRKNGSAFPIEVSARLIHIEGRPYILAIDRDITDRKQAEKKLLAAHDDMERLVNERTAELTMANEQLRNLSMHLQNAREQERTTIAREIHDELGQSLTAMKMELSVLRKKLPRNQRPVMARAASIEELVESTIQSVKRISSDLRPGILDHLGLTAAIEWQAQELQRGRAYPATPCVSLQKLCSTVTGRQRFSVFFRKRSPMWRAMRGQRRSRFF
jgi:two-component system, sensor histidine kinase and response regulator